MTCFIIDTYDKYSTSDKEVSKLVFKHNDRWWAIKEYEIKDGVLMRPQGIEERENMNDYFRQYETFDEAYAFVKLIKSF